jgi:hypothetical protein
MNVARAFLFEYRRRHRLALIVLAGYLLTFLVLKATVLGSEFQVRLAPPNGFSFFAILPGTAALFYAIGVFTYGLAGDLAARESIYPRRMLTLPITTAALVGWPMLFGSITAATLWVVMALFMRAAGADYPLPLVWPAILCALYIAWMQAITWMPYGLPGIRVVAAVLWLFIVDAMVITAFEWQVPDAVMVAILAPQLPLAYLVALFAVARARRGVVPDWSVAWRAPAELLRSRFRRRRAFRSAGSAQFWFEWRRTGRALPAMVALVVPAELMILFIPNNNTRTPGIIVPVFALLLPPVLAFFSATAFATPSAFTATRPLTDASLIAAKLKSTVLSTLLAWLIVLIAIPVVEIWSGASVPVIEWVRSITDSAGVARPVALAAFVILALMLLTWRQLVQNLCITLTGNQWLIKSTVVIGLIGMAIVGPGLQWFVRSHRAQVAVWETLPLILVIIAVVKFTVGAIAAWKLHARQVVTDATLVWSAVIWFAAVALGYGAITWWAASPLIPAYLKASIAILLMPFACLWAAPLALAWSRHR